MHRDGRNSYKVGKPKSKPGPKPPKHPPAGGGGFGSWGGGLGITPEAVGGFYDAKNPDGSYKNDPNNNFRPTWTQNRAGAEAAAAASAEQQRQAWLARTMQAASQQKALADRWARNLKDLQDSLNGLKSYGGERVAEYYGFDLKTAKGRADTQAFLRSANQVVLKSQSGDPNDLIALQEFDKQVHSGAKNALHYNFTREQAQLEAAAKAEQNSNFYSGLAGPGHWLRDAIAAPFGGGSGHSIGQAALTNEVVPVLGGVDTVLSKIGFVNQGYSAYQYAKLHGADTADQIGALVGGAAVGLGITDRANVDWYLSNDAIEAVSKTATAARREELTKRGDLISFGQYYTHQWDTLNSEAKHYAEANRWDRWLPKTTQLTNDVWAHAVQEATQIGDVNLTSGAIDMAWQYYTDPFTIGGKVMEGLGLAGELGERAIGKAVAAAAADAGEAATVKFGPKAIQAITRVARANYTVENHVYRGVEAETIAALRKIGSGSVDRVLNILGRHSVDRVWAARVTDAVRNLDDDGLRKVLAEGFITGEWTPERKFVGQVLRRYGYVGNPQLGSVLPRLIDRVRNFGANKKYAADVLAADGSVLYRKGSTVAKSVRDVKSAQDVLDVGLDRVLMNVKEDKRFLNGQELLARVGAHAALLPENRIVDLVSAADELNIPQFRALVDDIIAPVIANKGKSLNILDTLSVAEADKFMRQLDYLDAFTYILRGNLDEDARNILLSQVISGWKRLGENNPARQLQQVVRQTIGQSWDYSKDTRNSFKKLPKEMIDELLNTDASPVKDEALRNWFRSEFEAAGEGSARWADLAQGLFSFSIDDGTMEQRLLRAIEIGDQSVTLRAVVAEASVKRPAALARAMGSLGSGLVDKAALSTLRTFASPFLGENQERIADFFYRYGAALGANTEEMRQISRIAEQLGKTIAEGGKPADAERFLNDLVTMAFTKAGLTKEDAKAWSKAHARDFFSKSDATQEQAFLLAAKDGEAPGMAQTAEDYILLSDGPFLGSQVKTTFSAPEVERVLKGVRHALAQNTDWFGDQAFATKLRAAIDSLAGAPGAKQLVSGVKKLFTLWKVMVTTHMFLPIVAVPAIWAVTGDPWQALAFGGVAAGAGLIRYKFRMNIQNRIDGVLYHGFTPAEWVPFYGRIYRKQQRLLYGTGRSGLLPNPELASWDDGLVGRWFRGKDAEWRAVTPTGKADSIKFIDGVDRAVNFQVDPETDEVVRLLLNERAGKMTPKQTTQAIDDFLKTEDGANWLAKNNAKAVGQSAEKRVARATQRPRQAIETIFPADGKLATARLEAFGPGRRVEQDELRQMLKDGHLPEAIHYQDAEHIATSPKALWAKFKDTYTAAAYGSARDVGYRETFFAVEHDSVLGRLLNNGMERERANQIAGNIALRRTNDLMFRYDNVSRFAHKVDFIAPFTGHRLFNAVSWTKAIVMNPGRALRIGEQMYRAFNSAVSTGLFYKDQFGSYAMTIPGQGAVANILGVENLHQEVSLTGFLAMTGEMQTGYDHQGVVGALAGGVLPHPGGPWWTAATRVIRETAPEIVGPDSPLPAGLRDFFWGHGADTSFVPPDAAKYVQLMVGNNPIWTAIDDDQAAEEINRLEIQLYQDMVAQHLREHPGDVDWEPSDDEVKQKAMSFMEAWQVFASVTPATPHPRFLNRDKFYELFNAWLGPRGSANMSPGELLNLKRQFVQEHPSFAPYVGSGYEWADTGFHDWEHSADKFQPGKGLDDATLQDLNAAEFSRRRRTKTLPEYKAFMREMRRRDDAQRAWSDAMNTPGAVDRARMLAYVDQQYPEQAKYRRSKAHAEAELAKILADPPGRQQDEDIDRWRHKFAPAGSESISRGTFNAMASKIRGYWKNGMSYHSSPWSLARTDDQIWAAVMGKPKMGEASPNVVYRDGTVKADVQRKLANLPPAEQVKFWLGALWRLDTDLSWQNADPVTYQRAYDAVRAQKKLVETQYGNVLHAHGPGSPYSVNEKSAYKARLQDQLSDQFDKLGDLRSKAKATKAQMDAAASSKNWTTFWSLKKAYDDQQQAIRDYQNTLHSGQDIITEALKHVAPGSPEQLALLKQLDAGGNASVEMHEAIRELTWVVGIQGEHGDAVMNAWKRVQGTLTHGDLFAPTAENAWYMALPTNTRAAYVNSMTIALNQQPGQGTERYDVNTSEAFARDIYGKGTNAFSVQYKLYWSKLTDFQRSLLEKNAPKDMVDAWKLEDSDQMEKDAKAGKGGGGHGFGRSLASSELGYAYAMMSKYSQRGGMAKPAAYEEYLKLPNNPAIKNAFLEKHPEVTAYIKAGPMANMPAMIRMMVQDIMVRNGKWEGEPLDIGAITDIGFAREQLDRYNKRTGPAPATYDLWLNMPSGQAKADYINAHPEIKEWLQLGPMAQMPEIYRDVVRDIMYRYHEWSASTDGMGDVISGYYRTPSYARQQYLAQHPELAAYWSALRPAEDAAISAQVDAYFSTPDPGAKAAMLAANPQLKQYFLDQRTKRYERFLNQVAQYMGQNPDLFKTYLDKQNQVLGDLLNKFAEPNLAREEHWLRPVKPTTRKTKEGGRSRA